MYCLFVETPCTEEQVAQLQMQVAALMATIDEKEAMGLGGFPDQGSRTYYRKKSQMLGLNEIWLFSVDFST